MELLRRYVHRNSEEAFATLVTRHVNTVYSAAWRKTGNAHAAEEITQAVFIILARKAERLREGTVLSGWLYQTARLTSASFLRTEIRRGRREQEAYMQSLSDEPAPDLWPEIEPLLEDAMGKLGERERDALALRFFEGKSFQEIGAVIGTSENAAKKRVGHGLEKLRKIFLKRGIASTTAILAAVMSVNSVQAAPVALTKTITAVAMTKGVAASGSTLTLIKTTLKIMAWTKAKITAVAIVGVVLATGTATVVIHHVRERSQTEISNGDEPWRVPGISSDAVAKLPPEVKILPTLFPNSGGLAAAGRGIDKFVGIGQPAINILWAAYNWPQARMIFATPEPQERYDFVATLSQGCREALQRELKDTLGLVGRHETRDMDVLLLKVRTKNAPGLRPPVSQGDCYLSHDGNRVEIKWANESLSKLTEFLESAAKMPIIDETGDTNHYRVGIEWEEPDAQDSEHKALQKVLLNQFGLELVPSHQPVEMLVVEKN